MAEKWIDLKTTRNQLASFFSEKQVKVASFGSTVNQTFEAFVFASVIGWYQRQGWKVRFRHPSIGSTTSKPGHLRLKFSTRGRPREYSYVECTKGKERVHVRHQIRVATKYYNAGERPPANVCLDVAVLKPMDVSAFSSDDFMPNDRLITFGEAKHMSAFAELVANFVGLVHEMQPMRLANAGAGATAKRGPDHPSPFLYVSGVLYPTAEGLVNTIRRRACDIHFCTRTVELASSFQLPVVDPPRRQDRRKKDNAQEVVADDVPF